MSQSRSSSPVKALQGSSVVETGPVPQLSTPYPLEKKDLGVFVLFEGLFFSFLFFPFYFGLSSVFTKTRYLKGQTMLKVYRAACLDVIWGTSYLGWEMGW